MTSCLFKHEGQFSLFTPYVFLAWCSSTGIFALGRILKMEAAGFSETLETTYVTTYGALTLHQPVQ
jgi:hypothetical protein